MNREIGKKVLLSGREIELKDIRNLEKHIYDYVVKNNEDYNIVIYEITGKLLDLEESLEAIVNNVKTGKILWKNDVFRDIHLKIKEQNEFIQNPFEVEEGVFQCKMCGSRRVYSYSRQDRSCDEGTSVYAQCVACKAQWRERG